MNRKVLSGAWFLLFWMAFTAEAGDGYPMKCGGEGADAKGCGYEEMVTFGGGMAFMALTGYCPACEKFVHLHWTRKGSPLVKPGDKVTPPPKPLGKVWDAATGRTLTIYACPHCKGPFAEIKSIKELTHCPKCNGGHFKIDKSKPRLAID